jgi:hypothetical protein
MWMELALFSRMFLEQIEANPSTLFIHDDHV